MLDQNLFILLSPSEYDSLILTISEIQAIQNLSNYPATLKCLRRVRSGCKGNNELGITVTSKSHKHNNKTKQKKIGKSALTIQQIQTLFHSLQQFYHYNVLYATKNWRLILHGRSSNHPNAD